MWICFQYVRMMIWWDLWVLNYDLRTCGLSNVLCDLWEVKKMHVLMKVYEKHEMRWIA